MLLTEFGRAWINPQFRLTAFKIAIAVGTVLIILNHGAAIVHGEMTTGRWFSALLTYIVPYTVNIHGQWTAQTRQTMASTGEAIKIAETITDTSISTEILDSADDSG